MKSSPRNKLRIEGEGCYGERGVEVRWGVGGGRESGAKEEREGRGEDGLSIMQLCRERMV